MGVLDNLAEGADALAEITSNVAAAGEKVLEIANQLVTARSIVVEVDNHLTDITLTRVRQQDNFSSGGFGVLPEDEIPPHSADIFGVQSKGGGIGTGVVGSVTYRGAGFTMLVGFNNPAVGNNSANVTLQGPTDTITRFRVSCLIGAGNAAAHARYQLNRHAPYSIRKWVADNNIVLRDPNQQPPSLVNDGLKIALPRSGFDLPPKGVPLRFRSLLVTGGDQSATSSS
jgi:hypothetical protein